jgi:S-formylglutathione hydrolase
MELIYVMIGLDDKFYKEGQLLVENFESAVREMGGSGAEKVLIAYHEGYDHSYYFVSTFGAAHVDFHARNLKN